MHLFLDSFFFFYYLSRLRVKEKTQIKVAQTASGINGTKRIPELTTFEERVVGVMSLDAVDGDGASREYGRPNFQSVRIVIQKKYLISK